MAGTANGTTLHGRCDTNPLQLELEHQTELRLVVDDLSELPLRPVKVLQFVLGVVRRDDDDLSRGWVERVAIRRVPGAGLENVAGRAVDDERVDLFRSGRRVRMMRTVTAS